MNCHIFGPRASLEKQSLSNVQCVKIGTFKVFLIYTDHHTVLWLSPANDRLLSSITIWRWFSFKTVIKKKLNTKVIWMFSFVIFLDQFQLTIALSYLHMFNSKSFFSWKIKEQYFLFPTNYDRERCINNIRENNNKLPLFFINRTS